MQAMSLVSGLAGRNPGAVADNLMKTNPQFAQLANEVAGKTPEQAFSERGLDFGMVKGFMPKF